MYLLPQQIFFLSVAQLRACMESLPQENNTTNAHTQSRPLIWVLTKSGLHWHGYQSSVHHYGGGLRLRPLRWGGRRRHPHPHRGGWKTYTHTQRKPLLITSKLVNLTALAWVWELSVLFLPCSAICIACRDLDQET